MTDQLFWNRGAAEGFFDVSSVAGAYFRELHVGRGAAFADWDNDGDIDAYIANNGGPGVLLRNDGGNTNNWLAVRLEGRASNRSALGAKLRTVIGSDQQIREVGSQSSYLSQNSLIQHFGVGNATHVDSLEIIWPSGIEQVLTGVSTNQILTVIEEGKTP
jgi:hypothetical protein